jgi:hypothetical protein
LGDKLLVSIAEFSALFTVRVCRAKDALALIALWQLTKHCGRTIPIIALGECDWAQSQRLRDCGRNHGLDRGLLFFTAAADLKLLADFTAR